MAHSTQSHFRQVRSSPVLKLKGLPYNATKEDVYNFFSSFAIVRVEFVLETETGRPSGLAFVEFASPVDAARALAKNNEHIGKRYVKLLRVPPSEMEEQIRGGTAVVPSITNLYGKRAAKAAKELASVGISHLPLLSQLQPQQPSMPRLSHGDPLDPHALSPHFIRNALPSTGFNSNDQTYVGHDVSALLSAFTGHQARARSPNPIMPNLLHNTESQPLFNSQYLHELTQAENALLRCSLSGMPNISNPQMTPSIADSLLNNLLQHQTSAAALGLSSDLRFSPNVSCSAQLPVPMPLVSDTLLSRSFVDSLNAAGGHSSSVAAGKVHAVTEQTRFCVMESGDVVPGSVVSFIQDGTICVISGLPEHATAQQVRTLLQGYQIEPNGVIMGLTEAGRPSGDAFVCFPKPEEAQHAASDMNGSYLGSHQLTFKLV